MLVNLAVTRTVVKAWLVMFWKARTFCSCFAILILVTQIFNQITELYILHYCQRILQNLTVQTMKTQSLLILGIYGEEYKRRIEASETVNIFDRTSTLINSENVTVADIDAGLCLIVNGIENCTLPLYSKPCGSVKEVAAGFTGNNLNVVW